MTSTPRTIRTPDILEGEITADRITEGTIAADGRLITLPGLEAFAAQVRPQARGERPPSTALQRRGLLLIAAARAAAVPIVVVESETRWWPPPDGRGRLDVNRQTLEALIRRRLVSRHAATQVVVGLTIAGMHHAARVLA